MLDINRVYLGDCLDLIGDSLNRNWICMDLGEEYCEEGINRINTNRGKLGIPLLTNSM
jgi:DNA modification methylase